MTTWKEDGYYGTPQGTVPPPPGFLPGGYPQPGYPQPGYPQPGYPQPGYPQPGYPQGGYPQGGYPQGGYPSAGYPGSFGGSPPPTAGMYNSTSYGEDPLGSHGFDFSDKSIRLGFIRKVYGILMVQLTVTLAFIALFTFHDGTKVYVTQHPALWWISLILMFVCLLSMACCGEVRRKAPMNFIFLSVFTLAESFLLGCATATFKKEEVFLAVLICTVVTLGLTLFAFQTKIDFTMMGGVLFVAALILMIFGIITIFWHGKIITLIYASFGALLFSIYIIYDTQIMLGGKHKYAISPEEYIFAALNLYLDIVNLFLYILTIIGASRD
ncbi:protein lifeguard 1 isoform X1 [Halyomorpha halys]|uniref:protein lifeguard 1 isoform X1 n=2 Tax=Halyomorpha halys TaxID=286706 RepID=UPI0006D4C78F|nr:protein lifeguard 1 isoform X1 [Halyomorpha halys]